VYELLFKVTNLLSLTFPDGFVGNLQIFG